MWPGHLLMWQVWTDLCSKTKSKDSYREVQVSNLLGHNVQTVCAPVWGYWIFLYFGSSFTGSLDSGDTLPFLAVLRMSCRRNSAIQPPWRNGNVHSQIRPALHPQWAWGTPKSSHHCLANSGHLWRVVFLCPNYISFTECTLQVWLAYSQ